MRAWICAIALSLAVFFVPTAGTSAFETKTLPEFAQLVAVQARPQGGFAVAGLLRDQAGKSVSGFVQIAADGSVIGPIVPLPPPDAQHPQAWVSSLLLLPDGDYVAAGLALDGAGKPDGWMIRFNPQGETIWNLLLPNPWDQRIINVRLVNGMLIGVGKTQEGARVQQQSLGYWVFVDPRTGKKDTDGNLKASPDTRRSGFYDVTESVDGGLVFAGWATKSNGTDDIWLAKYAKGQDDRSLIFGEADNDVAYTVIPSGAALVVGATRRKTSSSPVGAVLIYDKNLNNPAILALDRWSPGLSQLKALFDIPSTGRLVIVGEAARTAAADTRALLAIIRVAAGSAAVETGPNEGVTSFRAVAIDSSGTIAMVGEGRDARNQPSRGLVGLRKGTDLCAPDAEAIKQIAATLAGPSSSPQAACATAEHLTRVKLSGGTPNTAIVVRPIVGDVDAFLVKGDDILDASVNTRMRTELLIPPADDANLELMVSSQTPFALFEISRKALPARAQQSASSGSASDKALDLAKDAVALQLLGYDLLEPARGFAIYVDKPVSDPDEDVQPPTGMRRAILAFQATEGLPMTGTLAGADKVLLREQAAAVIDTAAQNAAGAARTVANNSPPVEYVSSGDTAYVNLTSMQGGVQDGRVYGQGSFNPEVTFEGEWLDGAGSGAQRRPWLGVLKFGDSCTIALHTFQLSSSYGFADLLRKSIGVIRNEGRVLYKGDLESVLPRRRSDSPINTPSEPDNVIAQLCNRG